MSNGYPLIRYVLDDFTEPWTNRPAPVVMLHPGLAGNGRLYRQWVPVLADRYRVLRVDARGQGMSPRLDGYIWSIDRFVADVLDVLDHHGIERVHWVGASGGGIIGQHAAASAGKRIASLTLLATTPRFRSPTANVDDWLAPLDRGDASEFFRQDTERRFGLEHPARTDWIVNEILRTPVQTIADLHRWVVSVDLTGELSGISCPTLIVTGERDTLTDLNDAGLMERNIPDARLHIIEGHPHNVGYTHPRLVAGIVRQFLDELPDEGTNDG